MASFCLFSVFSNKQYNFHNKSMCKNHGLFSFIFRRFEQTIQFLQQINVQKCNLHPI